jgi:hypothetical protein
MSPSRTDLESWPKIRSDATFPESRDASNSISEMSESSESEVEPEVVNFGNQVGFSIICMFNYSCYYVLKSKPLYSITNHVIIRL